MPDAFLGGFVRELALPLAEHFPAKRVLVVDLVDCLNQAPNGPRADAGPGLLEWGRHITSGGALDAMALQAATVSLAEDAPIDLLLLGPDQRVSPLGSDVLTGLVGWRMAREIVRVAGEIWEGVLVCAGRQEPHSTIQWAFMDCAVYHLELSRLAGSENRPEDVIWEDRRARIHLIDRASPTSMSSKAEEGAAWSWAIGWGGRPGLYLRNPILSADRGSVVRWVRDGAPSIAMRRDRSLFQRIRAFWSYRREYQSYWTILRIADFLAAQFRWSGLAGSR